MNRRIASPLRLGALLGVLLATGFVTAALLAQAQAFDSNQKTRAKQMLGNIKMAIQNTYYDPAFHGIDLNAKFKDAEKRIDGATSQSQAYAIIAQTLLDFGDSHLFFVPPMRPSTFEYGWAFRMVGDKCFVLAVKPGSDADKKGLKVGDQVLQIDTLTPSRSDLWKIKYLYYQLSPRTSLKVVAQSPGGQPRELSVAAEVTKKSNVMEISIENFDQMVADETRETLADASRVTRVGDVAIWKLESFTLQASAAERILTDATKGASALVIDMRGNGGGLVETLQRIVSKLFDADTTIATVKQRKSSKAMTSSPRRPVFTGKLVVLVDAESASAAELLARVVQLNQRGTVLGDTSAGAVMEGRLYQDGLEGLEGVIVYGASVTDADLIMKDGNSLEHVGVTPDQPMLPTAEDLAAGRDPVLAKAVALAGGTLDNDAAGKLFPIRWKK